MPTPHNPPTEGPLHDAHRGILEHIAGWAVILAFWGLVSILLTFGAVTDGISNFIWPGRIDRVTRLHTVIISVKWNVRTRLRGLWNFVRQLGASTQQRILGTFPAELWDAAGHFEGGDLPYWAFHYVQRFWIRRLQLTISMWWWTMQYGREWLADLARQLGGSVLQLLRGALPTLLLNLAADVPGLNLPFAFVVYVWNFWQTQQDQRVRPVGESSESSASGSNGLRLQEVEDRPPSQHETQGTDAQPEPSPEEEKAEELHDDDDDEPMPKVTRDRSPPPPPPSGGFCYSQDFGTLPTGSSRGSGSQERSVPTARTLSPSAYPQSGSPDGIQERTPTSTLPSTSPPPSERSDGPSSCEDSVTGGQPEELYERVEESASCSSINEAESRFEVTSTPATNGAAAADTEQSTNSDRALANSPSRRSPWSPLRLLDELCCAANDMSAEMMPPPDPVFADPSRRNEVSSRLRPNPPRGILKKAPSSSTELTSLPPSPSPDAPRSASMHSAKRTPSRDASGNIIPPRNLGNIDEEEGSPPPITSPKKRNKKVALAPAPRKEEATNSYGIDHRWSGSDSGMLRPANLDETDANDTSDEVADENAEPHQEQKPNGKGKQTERGDSVTKSNDPELGSVREKFKNLPWQILPARVPEEPNPAHLFGRRMSFISPLILPLMASCEHYFKPSMIYEPPSDVQESVRSI